MDFTPCWPPLPTLYSISRCCVASLGQEKDTDTEPEIIIADLIAAAQKITKKVDDMNCVQQPGHAACLSVTTSDSLSACPVTRPCRVSVIDHQRQPVSLHCHQDTPRFDLSLSTFTPSTFPFFSIPPFSIPPSSIPPSSIPPFSIPPSTIPPSTIPLSTIPPFSIPPSSIPPFSIPPSSIPPSSIPPSSIPPFSIPPFSIPPSSIPGRQREHLPAGVDNGC
ncbi:hypothetical protein ACOMHN_029441 [Nucella lapillus]